MTPAGALLKNSDRGSDQLEAMLRHWGRVWGEAPPREWDEGCSTVYHPIATAMQYAPARHQSITRRDVARVRTALRSRLIHLGRDGENTIPTPSWAVDPIKGRDNGGGAGLHVDPIADAVERGALDLHRAYPLRAVCLRIEYCTRGRQREKAERAGSIINMRLALRRYRWELDLARAWMSGRLNIAIAA